MKIGLLCSGGLGFTLLGKLQKLHNVVFVMTDRSSIEISNFCEQKSIDVFIGNPRGGRAAEFILGKKIDVLVSINYLFIIENDIIRLPEKIAFNIHGSLLPKYRGRTPHIWAIICNEKKAGITAHVIDEGCDTGDIIEQLAIPIKSTDTGGDILAKYNRRYFSLVKSVLRKIETNEIRFRKQNHTNATCYGKRTPDDGKIDWNWHKERIRNWVRAQAHPYPGAFSYIENTRLIIDEVEYDDFGFSSEMPNGLILSTNPFLVKTPNGVLKLNKVRNYKILIQEGKLLS
jgi:methionyl-tRNA formyltransferase